VEVLGLIRTDYQWQAQAGQGVAATNFVIDWRQRQTRCPMGQVGQASISWTPATDRQNNEVIKIKFAQHEGQACASRPDCIRAKRRTITVRPEEQHMSLQAARPREQTEAYKAEYAKRAGIEGAISQAVCAFGVRRARYRGAAKTHLQHVLMATAINFMRVGVWLAADRPATTRQSRFQALMAQSAAA
jgi:transposase